MNILIIIQFKHKKTFLKLFRFIYIYILSSHQIVFLLLNWGDTAYKHLLAFSLLNLINDKKLLFTRLKKAKSSGISRWFSGSSVLLKGRWNITTTWVEGGGGSVWRLLAWLAGGVPGLNPGWKWKVWWAEEACCRWTMRRQLASSVVRRIDKYKDLLSFRRLILNV